MNEHDRITVVIEFWIETRSQKDDPLEQLHTQQKNGKRTRNQEEKKDQNLKKKMP